MRWNFKFQENTDDEIRELRERLANVELRAETVQGDYARALATAELEKTTNKQLHSEIEQLRIDLKTEQDKCKEICSSYDKYDLFFIIYILQSIGS